MKQATGHVRLMERERGAVFYAALRLPNGKRFQRKLGMAWLKRSKPPAGCITRSQAEARLEVISPGVTQTFSSRELG
jgi:hypothetical protein